MAQYDDPFGDADRTILKPIPGGGERLSRTSPSTDAATRLIRQPSGDGLRPRSTGLNPLASAASPLLVLLTRLKNTSSHPDPVGLRNQLIEEIKKFDSRARELGISDPTLLKAARYVLCTALDDVILNTPWGSTSLWQQQSLLITFHKEAWGGEKFFRLLETLLKDPGRNLDLLELLYLCLSLGFQGRYRVLKDGRNQLETVRERLYHTLRTQRGDFERELSPHWQGVVEHRNPLLRYVPLWVIAALAGVLLVGIYLFFSLRLSGTSDPVFAALNDMGREVVKPGDRPPPPLPPPDRRTVDLQTFLQPEINRKQVTVDNRPEGNMMTILQSLFASGSATIDPAQLPLLQRIAEALNTVADKQFQVIGHTDNVPIKSTRLRFPDNYSLSLARAEAVRDMLIEATHTPDRFPKAEGRADKEPIADNATPEGRALNRRVEIVLLPRKGRRN
ncbi:MAG: type IVB secretion system protein IcmH/DotU [Candidatus Competibacteraceae bacterium]